MECCLSETFFYLFFYSTISLTGKVFPIVQVMMNVLVVIHEKQIQSHTHI